MSRREGWVSPRDASATVHRNHAYRVEGSTDYYWLYNPGTSAVTGTISFEGHGRPYALDGWSGEIEPIAEYRSVDGRVLTEVTLAPGETTTVALTPSDNRFGVKPAGHGVLPTDLDVGYELPGLEDVSGVGTYTRTVDLPDTWSGRNGAYLDLGQVFDTVVVRINGHELAGVDLINPRVRIDHHLRAGKNTVEVEVATTLRNRMRTVAGSGHATRPRQPYGLVGPVVLSPYVEVPIR